MEQPRCPQVHRTRPHDHQRQPALATPDLLQGQEAHPARPAPQADPRDAETPDAGGEEPGEREAEEEAKALPAEELRCQGELRSRRIHHVRECARLME